MTEPTRPLLSYAEWRTSLRDGTVLLFRGTGLSGAASRVITLVMRQRE